MRLSASRPLVPPTTTRDERFRTGAYPSDPEPAPLLERYLDALEPGRALGVAAGTGRNAVPLADRGYRVHAVDRLPDIKDALRPGGVLFYEHHLRSTDASDAGPDDDRYRFGANELLHACLDLTVLAFDARTETRPDGRTAMRTQIVARNSAGRAQSYPAVGRDAR